VSGASRAKSRVYPYRIAVFREKAVPTMTEWGMIIFMVIAGLGAFYFIRRQRRAEN